MKQILDLAKKLISIPSTSDNPKALEEVLDICRKELKGFNFKDFEKERVKSLLFYNTDSLPNSFRLILNGHLDVVSAKENQYSYQQEGNKLYGRGVYDMKTSVTTFILLFKEIAKKVKYPLGLQLVTDEEVGGFLGTKYQIDQGIKAEFVIAGENTDLKVNDESKGIIWMKVTTRGTSAHGAYPWIGENAIWKMHKFLQKLEKLYPIPSKEIWATTVNLARLETSNKAVNKIPDDCNAYLDIRYIPSEEKTILGKLKEEFGNEVEMEVLTREPSHLTNKSNMYITKLLHFIKVVTGKEGELKSHHGSSDIRHYNKVGIEGTTFGPIGGNHHSDHEWLDISSIEDYYNILKNFLENLD